MLLFPLPWVVGGVRVTVVIPASWVCEEEGLLLFFPPPGPRQVHPEVHLFPFHCWPTG